MNIVVEFLKSKRNRLALGLVLAGLGSLMALSHAGSISALPIISGIVLVVSSQGASGPRQYN